jgi:hypothetical protein
MMLCHHAECRVLSIINLNTIMLSVVMLNVIKLTDIPVFTALSNSFIGDKRLPYWEHLNSRLLSLPPNDRPGVDLIKL